VDLGREPSKPKTRLLLPGRLSTNRPKGQTPWRLDQPCGGIARVRTDTGITRVVSIDPVLSIRAGHD
jgi:hypothetical protein